MEVLCTSLDTEYACDELAWALRQAAPRIREVAREFTSRADDRSLIIVLLCPCCANDPWMDLEGAVLVTPFHGIDPARYRGRIYEVEYYPPFRTPGQDGEAATIDEFLASFRQTIERALASR